ncbi:hypothetical protein L1887_26787 [Cichorium endivia]|nr:hypothetical protein L1887_26787 [Cichorium endivia]
MMVPYLKLDPNDHLFYRPLQGFVVKEEVVTSILNDRPPNDPNDNLEYALLGTNVLFSPNIVSCSEAGELNHVSIDANVGVCVVVNATDNFNYVVLTIPSDEIVPDDRDVHMAFKKELLEKDLKAAIIKTAMNYGALKGAKNIRDDYVRNLKDKELSYFDHDARQCLCGALLLLWLLLLVNYNPFCMFMLTHMHVFPNGFAIVFLFDHA